MTEAAKRDLQATRWLSPEEDRAWRGLHLLRTDLMAQLSRRLYEDCGMTEADYVVLMALSEAPDHRMRARELGMALNWERSRLSHQIRRMEARGSVARGPCPDDARGFVVILTALGLRSIEAAAPLHVAEVRRLFIDLLTPEQLAALGGIAEVVEQFLATDVRSGEPDPDRNC